MIETNSSFKKNILLHEHNLFLISEVLITITVSLTVQLQTTHGLNLKSALFT